MGWRWGTSQKGHGTSGSIMPPHPHIVRYDADSVVFMKKLHIEFIICEFGVLGKMHSDLQFPDLLR